MNEEKALLVSRIPDSIWIKYKLTLSSSGDWLWWGKKNEFHFKTDSIQFVHIYETDICITTGKSFVFFAFKRHVVQFCFA